MRSRIPGCILFWLILVIYRYVTDLPSDTTEELLNDVFKRYGLIQQNMDGTPRVGVSHIALIRRLNSTEMKTASLRVMRLSAIFVKSPFN